MDVTVAWWITWAWIFGLMDPTQALQTINFSQVMPFFRFFLYHYYYQLVCFFVAPEFVWCTLVDLETQILGLSWLCLHSSKKTLALLEKQAILLLIVFVYLLHQHESCNCFCLPWLTELLKYDFGENVHNCRYDFGENVHDCSYELF